MRLIGRPIAMAAAAVGAALLWPALAGAQTIVSIQFDDGYAEHSQAGTMLAAHDMRGTFYINSGLVGTSGNMTWSQIQTLHNAGHEIGGHTLTHPHLPELTVAEQTAEVCDDAAALRARGYPVTSFAYPYGEHTTATQAIVQGCGYNTARTTCGIGMGSSPYAESAPPPRQFATRTQGSATSATTLADLQGAITQAETHGGGWVHLVFHQLCSGCSIYGVPPATLEALLDWLQPRAAGGTVVQTVREVMAGTPPPPPPPDVQPPSVALTAPANGATVAGSVPLRATASDNVGVVRVEFRLGTSVLATDTTAPYSATWNSASRPDGPATITARAVDGAGNSATTSVTVAVDNIPPDVPPAPGPGPNPNPNPPPAAPGAPTVNTVAPASTDRTAPQTVVRCNGRACTATFGTVVTVALAATDDGSGVSVMHYTTDGTEPTLTHGKPYEGPFRVWGPTTLRYASWDAAGNGETPGSAAIVVKVRNVAPNGGFEVGPRHGAPTCWRSEATGRNQGDVGRTSAAHSGDSAVTLELRRRGSGDRRLYVVRDRGRCATAAVPGRGYRLRVWYRGAGPRLFIWHRATDGAWRQWATSRQLPSSRRWTLAVWETPPLPDGTDNVSAGVSLARVGAVTIDDLSLQ